jgi:hypothetical protein
MATTVEITLSDDGKVLVGITDTPSDPSAMQPAGSIQEALAMARHILQPGKVAGPQVPGSSNGEMATGLDRSGAMSDGTTVQSDGTASGGDDPRSSGDSASATDPRALWDELANQAIPRH